MFEKAQQPLKVAFYASREENAHIYAVHIVIAKDCFTRLVKLWEVYAEHFHYGKVELNCLIDFVWRVDYFDIEHDINETIRENIEKDCRNSWRSCRCLSDIIVATAL